MIMIIQPSAYEARYTCFDKKRRVAFDTIFPLMPEETSEHGNFAKVLPSLIRSYKIDKIGIHYVFGGMLFGPVSPVNEVFFRNMEELRQFRPAYMTYMLEFTKQLHALCENIPMLALFETGFFRELPEIETVYALPEQYVKLDQYRRWGAHGIMHESNMSWFKKNQRIISLVFDKTSSICGMRNGNPLTTSAGYTMLEGIMGTTSCGDIDPGLLFYIMKEKGYSIHKLNEVLTRESGFYGMTGRNIDQVTLYENFYDDEQVQLAFAVFINHIRRHIGEAAAVMGGIDDIVMSGPYVKGLLPVMLMVISEMSIFDIHMKAVPLALDKEYNTITYPDSKIGVHVSKRTLEYQLCVVTEKYFEGHVKQKDVVVTRLD